MSQTNDKPNQTKPNQTINTSSDMKYVPAFKSFLQVYVCDCVSKSHPTWNSNQIQIVKTKQKKGKEKEKKNLGWSLNE